jgi:methylamine dehydrogenase heavy chain
MIRMNSTKAILVGVATAVLATAAAAQTQSPPPPAAAASVPQAEVSDVAVLPPASRRWVYASGGFGLSGVRIFDGDSGKMKGLIQVPSLGALALDPQGRHYYVAETIWTKITRGTRQDMVSIYDANTLKLVSEVSIPNRLLGGTSTQNFTVSNDGKLAFVYNMLPSSSVQVVDLEKRKLRQTVELPGCAALFASGPDGVSALCSDGSMASVTFGKGGKATVSHTAPFFSANTDPVFDNVVVDRTKNVATFISYTGKVFTAALGVSPKVEAPWSIQAAAGLREGVAAPLDVNWTPGGRQPFAVDRVTGRIYVLMHVGEQWSHKEPGEEIWVVDIATRKVISRHPTPGKVGNIQVSQEATPQVYVSGGQDGRVWILDGTTLETKYNLERAGGGALFVVEPS